MSDWATFIKQTAEEIKDAVVARDYRRLASILERVSPNDDRFKRKSPPPLLIALRYGDLESVRIVLDAGADPNGRGLFLHYLSKPESSFILDKLNLLLRYGASFEKLRNIRGALEEFPRKREAKEIWELLKPHIPSYKEQLSEGWEGTLLGSAAYYFRGDFLERLSREGFDLKARFEKGRSLIHRWAGEFSSLGEDPSLRFEVYKDWIQDAEFTLNVLLKAGLKINEQDGLGNTPLHYLCKSGGRIELLDLLLQKGADPGVPNLDGRTPLFFLPRHAPASLKLLLQYGARADVKDRKNETPLVRFGGYSFSSLQTAEAEIEFLRTLLAAGADPREASPSGNSLLLLLLRDTSIFAKLQNPNFPKRAFYELIEEIFRRGIDPNWRTPEGNTALHRAVRDPELSGLLLKRGADPNAQNEKGETPAHLAAEIASALRVLPLLKEAGADLNAVTALGESVGFYYVRSPIADVEGLKALATLGVNFRDKRILFWIVENWRETGDFARQKYERRAYMLRFLIEEAGLSPDVEDNMGNTPLHIACSRKHCKLAELLVQLGAKTWKKNSEGETPGDKLVGSKRSSSAFPDWGIRLGLLPLKRAEVLLDILKNEPKVVGAKNAIEKFFAGLQQEDPFALMEIFPLLFTLPVESMAFQAVISAYVEIREL